MRWPIILQILAATAVSVTSFAGERGAPADAKAMLHEAVAHFNSAGRQQALADFNAGKAPFRDRDLYVVCIGADHKISANGGFPQYVGMSADVLKDASGKLLGRAIVEAVERTGEGSVAYMMVNPASGKVEPKVLYAQKVGDEVCGVGAYHVP
ncbi:MAG TPA: cache domain-containing protein [Nitrospira sp.]|nr:cache domain-containing protein [Nitrospira sp.]